MTNRPARTMLAVILTSIALTACGDDEPTTATGPASPASSTAPVPATPAPVTEDVTSDALSSSGDLPTVNFRDITDCPGQLGDVDPSPVYVKASSTFRGKVDPPKNLGDRCDWQGSLFSVVTGYPESSAFVGDIDDEYETGAPIQDTAGYSAAWASDRSVTFAARAPDGLVLRCEFQQSTVNEDGVELAKAADMVEVVRDVCAEVIEQLVADADGEPVTSVDFSALPEIPARFAVLPFNRDCSALAAIDTTALLGVDVEPRLEEGNGISGCWFQTGPKKDGNWAAFELHYIYEDSVYGTNVGSRDIPTVDAWTSAVIESQSTTDSLYDNAGVIELSAVDGALMYRVICRYADEASPAGSVADKKLIDQVEEKVGPATEFCTRALATVVLNK